MNRLVLIPLFALTACTGLKLSTARQTVFEQTQCPKAQLNVYEGPGGWFVDGCGTRYLCQVPEGPCAENLTPAQQLTRARATFARETGCLLADVSVAHTTQGLVAQGCGRYTVCASPDGPCVPSRPPTCAEIAQERYDACIDTARRDGQTGSHWFAGRYGAAATVAESLIKSSQGERLMAECRHRYDTETAQCR